MKALPLNLKVRYRVLRCRVTLCWKLKTLNQDSIERKKKVALLVWIIFDFQSLMKLFINTLFIHSYFYSFIHSFIHSFIQTTTMYIQSFFVWLVIRGSLVRFPLGTQKFFLLRRKEACDSKNNSFSQFIQSSLSICVFNFFCLFSIIYYIYLYLETWSNIHTWKRRGRSTNAAEE